MSRRSPGLEENLRSVYSELLNDDSERKDSAEEKGNSGNNLGNRAIVICSDAEDGHNGEDSNASKGSEELKQKFQCFFAGCGFVARHRSDLFDHKKKHNGEKKYHCTWPDCNREFIQKGELTVHTRTHTGERPYHCAWPDCGKKFKQKPHLDYHIGTHTVERPHKCRWTGCDAAFTLYRHLREHTTIHDEYGNFSDDSENSEYKFKCSHNGCSYKTKHRTLFRLHTRVHTGERPYKCTWTGCDMAFTQKGNLNKHTRTHTGERPYRCTRPGCNKAFTQSNTLKIHIQTHTGKENLKNITDKNLAQNAPIVLEFSQQTDKTFEENNQNLREVDNHEEENMTENNQQSIDSDNMPRRSLRISRKPPPTYSQFPADDGDEEALAEEESDSDDEFDDNSSTGSLDCENDMDDNSSEYRFKCSYAGCRYKTNIKLSLQYHFRAHTGERPYPCTWPGCDKKFAFKQRLQIHLRTHTGERPYPCTWPGCYMRFTQSHVLKTHTQIHKRRQREHYGWSIDDKEHHCEREEINKRIEIQPRRSQEEIDNHQDENSTNDEQSQPVDITQEIPQEFNNDGEENIHRNTEIFAEYSEQNQEFIVRSSNSSTVIIYQGEKDCDPNDEEYIIQEKKIIPLQYETDNNIIPVKFCIFKEYPKQLREFMVWSDNDQVVNVYIGKLMKKMNGKQYIRTDDSILIPIQDILDQIYNKYDIIQRL